MSATTRFDRFVTAVHRRAVVLRLVEGFGAGAAVGAGFALLVILISLKEGVHWQAVAFFGVFPAIASTIAWWQRRPSRLAALIDADRQLNLDDLLSSAFTAKDDAFGRAVRMMAEKACGTLSPSQVVLNSLGARAWGGIGLAWATVIVLGLLAGGGTISRAGDRSMATAENLATKPGQISASSAQHQATVEKGVDENRSGGSTNVEQPTAGQSVKTGSNTGEAAAGAGGGQAKINTGGNSLTDVHPSTAGATTPNGEAAGGTGSGQAGVGSVATGGLAGRPLDRAAAPWQSDHWPADRATALQAVRDGRVPDAYRDLVRDYFELKDR